MNLFKHLIAHTKKRFMDMRSYREFELGGIDKIDFLSDVRRKDRQIRNN